MTYLRNELQKLTIFLLPLRLFIGLILIQSGLGKFFIPEWSIGTPLKMFLQEQLQNGDIIFPFYQTLIDSVILPNAALFSGLILFAEVYSGIAILIGCFTNLALIVAIFLNLNLLLAGNPNPSVIYIVCQAILLGTNSGAVLGFDTALSTKIHSSFLVAQAEARHKILPFNRLTFITAAACFFLLALLNLSYVQDRSVNPLEDTASSLAILSMMTSIMLVFFAFRATIKTHQPELINEPARLLEVAPNHRNIPEARGHSLALGDQPMSPTVDQVPQKNPQKGEVNITARNINQFSKLLVPHQIADRAARIVDRVTKRGNPKQDEKTEDAKSDSAPNPLHKLYLD